MAKRKMPQAVTSYSETDAWHTKTHELWDIGQYRLAFRRFLAAAKRGDAYAQSTLGYFYDRGIGVPRRQSVALHWYKRAYRQGDACAANNAGTIYRDRGDIEKALMWFNRAIALGDVCANWNIAKMYFRQRRNIPKTILQFKRVIETKRGIDVSQWEFDTATRFLRWMEHRKPAA